jgi:Ca2+:H+ antiporter
MDDEEEDDFNYDPMASASYSPGRASKLQAELDIMHQSPSPMPILYSSNRSDDGRAYRTNGHGRPTIVNHRRSVSVNDIGPHAEAVSLEALTAAITPMGAQGYVGVRCRRDLRKMLKKQRGRNKFDYHSSERPSDGISHLETLSEDSPLIGISTKSAEESSKEEDEEPNDLAVFKEMIMGKYINILLLVIPVAVMSHHLQWSPATVFWLNFMAMIPLASMLGDFTEEVAEHTNEVVGGLVNATMGNAVEVVVAIQALLAGEIRIVQASMIGSIFSNLLLVLGGCFFVGGLHYKEQSFNSTAATANMSLLALSSLALVLPTPFGEYYDIEEPEVLAVSRFAAVFLMFMYLQLLIFQLKTHGHLFEDEDEAEPEMHFSSAVFGLTATTVIIAILSEYLVGSIDGFCTESGISRTFVGLIILPVVGNAVEHITAVSVAAKDKMDLAMGVAVGSCTQISLFVMPLTVIIGWCAGIDVSACLSRSIPSRRLYECISPFTD